eukprot:8293-Heterococcus_DN1.PRE.1
MRSVVHSTQTTLVMHYSYLYKYSRLQQTIPVKAGPQLHYLATAANTAYRPHSSTRSCITRDKLIRALLGVYA